jgi:HEAT repeat protein
VRRNQVYDDLRALGDALVPAIGQGLTDPDVQVRRNVALFLNAEGSSYSSFWGRPRLDIRPYLPALAAALADADSRVRGLSAHAIGLIGPEARSAVPVLITLLANPNEGSRGSACIALVGIGPPARAALPALRKALSDSSLNVRFQALRAIGSVNALH